MTQQVSSHIVETHPVTQSVCAVQGDKAISKTVAGTLRYHKEQFAKGHKCICPKRFVIPVRAYNTDYVEQQCQICANVFGRVYD